MQDALVTTAFELPGYRLVHCHGVVRGSAVTVEPMAGGALGHG